VTISTEIVLYGLSIIAGVVLLVYGFSIQPRKGKQPLGSHSLDALTDSSIPIDAGHTLHPKDDLSEEQEALDRNSTN
jgi:hypothetical protein